MAKTRLIIPLLNLDAVPFGLPVLYLAETRYVGQIADDDYFTLHRDAEAVYVPLLRARTICLSIDDPVYSDATAFARAAGICTGFVFNTFVDGPPLALTKAAFVSKEPRNQHERTVDLEAFPIAVSATSQPLAFKTHATPDALINLHKVVAAVAEPSDKVLLTLDRFNASLCRPNPHDQIIDITISLESLIESVVELKFKFSLFNSFIAETEASKRQAAFELLQLLYDARSSIVHGDMHSKSNKTKIERALASMADIRRLAGAAIKYYLVYLYSKRPTEWRVHLERLVMGVDSYLGA